jgi:hypothetical protein
MANEVLTIPFGVGELYLTTNDAVPVSHYVGGLQELQLKITKTSTGFKGAYLFDLATFITGAAATLSAKYGAFKAGLSAAVLGGVVSAGSRILIQSEALTISGGTATALNTTGFVDKGVCDETGKALTRVASGATPQVGEYKVTSGGVYTFDTGANGKAYTARYTYTSAVTGKSTAISNALMAAPTSWFSIDAFNPAEGTGFVFPKALATNLDIPRKNTDPVVQSLEFNIIPDSTGLLGTIYTPS